MVEDTRKFLTWEPRVEREEGGDHHLELSGTSQDPHVTWIVRSPNARRSGSGRTQPKMSKERWKR